MTSETSRLVGRATELATLARALEALRARSGGVVLVEGEAGIGKTRLVAELAAQAASLGCRVLQAACYESQQQLPYAPLLDLFRALLDGPAAEVASKIDLLRPSAAYLLTTLPELSDWLPFAVAAGPLDAAAERRRFLHTIGRVFAALAAQAPLLVVVEDLHWADEASLELLAALARGAAAGPFLLVLTCRDDSAGCREPVHTELNRRLPATTHLKLGPLRLVDADTLIRRALGLDRPTPAELLHVVYRLTEGNPLFVGEIVRSLPPDAYQMEFAGGVVDQLPIPRTVQEAVQRRVQRLSPATRTVLEVAAAIGQRVQFDLLQELADCSEADLLQHLKVLVNAQLLEETRSDEFAFHHALTRQAVYVRLLGRERRALHERIGLALERRGGAAPDAHASELAYHFHAAADWSRTRDYAVRAGERALALHAPHSAVEQFTRAMAAERTLGARPESFISRLRGRAYEILGDFSAARADYESAAGAARDASDRRQEWEALIALGVLWTWRDYNTTGAYFRQALALADATGDASLVAHSANRIGNWHLNVGDPLLALQHHRDALSTFERVGDEQGIADTLSLLAMSCFLVGDLRQGTDCCQRAIDAQDALGDIQAAAENRASLVLGTVTMVTDTCVPALSPADALHRMRPALEMTRESGWRSGEAFAQFNVAYCLGELGDYTGALAAAHACLGIAAEIDHGEWTTAGLCTLGGLHRDLLSFGTSREYLERGLAQARAIGSSHWMRIASAHLTSTLVEAGDLSAAELVLGQTLTDDTPTLGPGRALWCARAELDLAAGRPNEALSVLQKLMPDVRQDAAEPPMFRPVYVRAQALALLRRSDEAVELLEHAVHWASEWGLLARLWRAQTTLGRVQAAQRRRVAAGATFAAARSLVEHIAAKVPLEGGLRTRFVSQAEARLPRVRPPSATRATKAAYGGLTRRELDVAALIAQARTNSEIAATLVVGERTVETHVAHILAKLALDSRRDVAAWALAQGLPVEARVRV